MDKSYADLIMNSQFRIIQGHCIFIRSHKDTQLVKTFSMRKLKNKNFLLNDIEIAITIRKSFQKKTSPSSLNSKA